MTNNETVPNSAGNPQEKGLTWRIKSKVGGWFSRPSFGKVVPPMRESAMVILARTTLPDREVSLGDINVYTTLPIDFGVARRLAFAINEIKETPIDQFELEQLKPSAAVYEAIPWAASAIAHHYNSEIPVILPNEEDVMLMRPWLRDVSQFLGRFSSRWQYRFGRFVERKAEDILGEAVKNILNRVDIIGQIDHPKARFVPELVSLYQEVTKPEYVEEDDFDLGSLFDMNKRPKKVRVPIEDQVGTLITILRIAKTGRQDAWVNRETYPLIAGALEISKFPPDSVDEDTASIAGSEIISGIEKFLRRQNITKLHPAPKPVKTFDFWDGNTWNFNSVERSFAETFAWDQVQAVKRSLPSILVEVMNLLPESGPEVTQAVRKLSEDILILSKQGVSNAEIAAALFRKS